jgi:hypothetical protein
MSLHKLSAGDGYTSLTRQVAAADDKNRGYGSLGGYYEQKGESPGVWLGSGLDSLGGSMPGISRVRRRGRGADDRPVRRRTPPECRYDPAPIAARGGQRPCVDRATKLGQEYRTYDANPFRERLAARYREHNQRLDRANGASIESDVRAHIRTDLAREMFTELHGRSPSEGRKLSGFLARASRPAPVAVAATTSPSARSRASRHSGRSLRRRCRN